MRSMTMSQMLVNFVYAQLRDSTGKMRWTRDELTRYVNLALRDAITRRPEAGLIVDDAFYLRYGAVQVLEPGAVRLKELVENLSPNVIACVPTLANDPGMLVATITGGTVSMPVPADTSAYLIQMTGNFNAAAGRTAFRVDTLMAAPVNAGTGLAYSIGFGVGSNAASLFSVTYRTTFAGVVTRRIVTADGGDTTVTVSAPNHRHVVDIDGPTKVARLWIDDTLVMSYDYSVEAGLYDFTQSRVQITGVTNQAAAANAGRLRVATLYASAGDVSGMWPTGVNDLCGNSISNQG